MDTAASFVSAVRMRIGPRITIVLADRYKLVRHGVRLLLDGERDLLVVGDASDEAQALELVAAPPDVLVAALGSGGMSGRAGAPRERPFTPGRPCFSPCTAAATTFARPRAARFATSSGLQRLS
jgi:hypothetical protein